MTRRSSSPEREEAPTAERRPSLGRRVLTRVAVVLVSCVVIPVALLFVFQSKFIYATDAEVLPIASVLPGGREVEYRTSDGLSLTGWFVPSRQSSPHCGPAPAALLFHGQGGNRSWEYPLANALATNGVSVFIAEYRGFAGLEGEPDEDGIATDARAAREALVAQPGVDATRIAYIGYSLGTGVATRLATDVAPKALVLLAPYTSLPDIAWERLPGIPYHVLMHDKFDTLSRIGSIDAPVLVVIGTADEIVPTEQSRRVYEAAKRPDAFIRLDGLNHGDIDARAGELAIDALRAFLARHVGCDPAR
jgi:uncharacterized protein